MPKGTVRRDLNKTGTSYRNGNPVPATSAAYNSNPVPPTSASLNSNPIPAQDASFNTNQVTWTPDPKHFGNNIS